MEASFTGTAPKRASSQGHLSKLYVLKRLQGDAGILLHREHGFHSFLLDPFDPHRWTKAEPSV